MDREIKNTGKVYQTQIVPETRGNLFVATVAGALAVQREILKAGSKLPIFFRPDGDREKAILFQISQGIRNRNPAISQAMAFTFAKIVQ